VDAEFPRHAPGSRVGREQGQAELRWLPSSMASIQRSSRLLAVVISPSRARADRPPAIGAPVLLLDTPVAVLLAVSVVDGHRRYMVTRPYRSPGT